MVFGLVTRFIDRLYIQLAATSYYNAIASTHTRAHAESSQFAFTSRFLVTGPNNEDSLATVLTSLLPRKYPTTELSRPGILVI
jgi:hypothetical protein